MSRLKAYSVAATISVLFFSLSARAQDSGQQLNALVKQYLAAHPEAIGAIVKDYVIAHPDVLRDALTDAMNGAPAGAALAAAPPAIPKPPVVDPSAAIKDNAAALFSSAHQVTLGDPHGDVTMVEFFDYNCGFCKGALPAMLSLLKDDPKLKIVLKEWPILGPGSTDAAHVAVAVRMQDPGGEKYLAFHTKLLGDPGPASKEKALDAALAAGLDMAKLQKDMDSPEVAATIDEDFALARSLGITGTPGYVVGKTVIAGAVGLDGLKGQIANERGFAKQ
jgi:protein-disulfide isomerase